MTADAPRFPARRGAVVDRDSMLHHNVLESMSEGVLTVNSDSRIGVFNSAASRLLGLASTDVRGRPFAEVFVSREGLEDFSDTLLSAIYDKAVGSRSTIVLRLEDDTERSLAMTTSYLVDRNHGETGNKGIVAVFGDITEIETLRKAERELAESLKEQNFELRDAYREIEENNKSLDSALKKVQAVRMVAMLLVVVLFGGAAWYVWDETGSALREGIAGTPGAAESSVTATVAPQQLTMTLSFVGKLIPRREVRVTSPTAGKVARVLFEYGEQVAAGQPLVELDTAEAKRRYREARATYLEARDKLRELENWKNSPEMSRVRRTVARAGIELEAGKSKLAETALLLRKGIVPASEHEAAERQYETQRLSHEAALQDLESTQAQADASALQIARLRLENATTRMQELEKTLNSAVIAAPVSGIVLQPGGGGQGGGEESKAEPLATGRSVSEGGYLLSVGDLRSLSIAGRIDEVDVVRVRPGQPVRIGGDAFPDLELKGEIARISPQAQREGAGRVPAFDVIANIDRLDDAHRGRLRLGMSANVVVVVRDEPAALLVPLAAVRGEPGKYWLRVRSNEGGEVRRVPVETGATTVNRVEIVRGLEAGDEVIVSGN